MSFFDIIILLVILLLVVFVSIYLFRHRGKTCSGGCAGCPHAKECRQNSNQNQNTKPPT